MRQYSNTLLAAIIFATLIFSLRATAENPVLFQTDFTKPNALKAWTPSNEPGISLVNGPKGRKVLAVERTVAEGAGSRMIYLPLPVEQLKGKRYRLEAVVKAENIPPAPQPYNGLKCMIVSQGPSGSRYTNPDNIHGTFDWQTISCTVEIPAEATEVSLNLGMQATYGKAFFDKVILRATDIRRGPAPYLAKYNPKCAIYKGHNQPRLRGAMISPNITEADLRVLGGDWKANHIRWQLLWGGFPHSPADKATVAEYNAWLEKALAHLDSLLPVCKELGIRVVIDVHTPPGGRNAAKEMPMFHEKKFQTAFLDNWAMIARRYKDNPMIWGYDLCNEPVEGIVGDKLMNWQQLAEAAAKRIRAIDPDRAIIVEPAPWGGIDALAWLQPLDLPHVVYSAHMYIPGEFTHQGVYDKSYSEAKAVAYPGMIGGVEWNKERLRKALQPAMDYQKDYNVHMYIGEFSAIRWAPGDSAYEYLRDLIDLFEENDWDWAYHAFREFDGWSVEHSSNRHDRQPSPTPTKRQHLLQKWFAKNKR